MSTAGKTTDGTRLKLKIAQEELAALKLSIQSQNNPSMIPLPHDNTEDMESNDNSDMDTDQHTDAQVLGAALAAPKREAIHPDNDTMEEDEHNVVYIGDDLSMYNVVYHGNDHSQEKSHKDDDEETCQATVLADAPDTSTAADSLEDLHSIEFIGSDPSQTSASDSSQSSALNQDPSQSSASLSDHGTSSSSSSLSSSAHSHNTAKLVHRITQLTFPKSLIKIN